MMGGFKLGKIFGFEVNIDWSWLLIFFLVVYSLAAGYFPTVYPGLGSTANWLMGIIAALLLFASVLVHEFSHSLVARSYGTEIKGITLFLFGGVSQAAEEPKKASEEFWMTIAGPVTSFALAAFFYVLGDIGLAYKWPAPVVAVCGYLAFINFLLGVFNLVPGFPLDGGRVLRSIIWGSTGDLNKATRYASMSGQIVGYLLMGFGFANMLMGGLVGGLWLVFIGWFLTGAARSSYEQLQMRQALSGVPVEQVMTTDVPVIPSETSVRSFVDSQLLRNEYSCYPVTDGEDVIGVVGAEEVRAVPSNHWDTVTVGEIAHRVDGAYKIAKSDDAWNALIKLASENVCRLMVVDGDRLQGTVGRDSLFRLVQMKMRLGL